MWMKQITVYQIHPEFFLSLDTMDTGMSRAKFHKLLPGETRTAGFVCPQTGEPDHYLDYGPMFLVPWANCEGVTFAVFGEKKDVPSDVLLAEVEKRIKVIESGEQRPVGKKERKLIKDEAKAFLLAKAFSRYSIVYGGIDWARHRLIIGSTNRATVETIISLFRRAFTDFPIYHWATMGQPTKALTQWAKGEREKPEMINLSSPVVVADPFTEEGGRQAAWKGVSPDDEALKEPLHKHGMEVIKTGVVCAGRCSFTLDEALSITGYRLLEIYEEEIHQGRGRSDDNMDFRALADFAMLEVRDLLDNIERWFGGRDASIPQGLLREDERHELMELESSVQAIQRLDQENGTDTVLKFPDGGRLRFSDRNYTPPPTTTQERTNS